MCVGGGAAYHPALSATATAKGSRWPAMCTQISRHRALVPPEWVDLRRSPSPGRPRCSHLTRTKPRHPGPTRSLYAARSPSQTRWLRRRRTKLSRHQSPLARPLARPSMACARMDAPVCGKGKVAVGKPGGGGSTFSSPSVTRADCAKPSPAFASTTVPWLRNGGPMEGCCKRSMISRDQPHGSQRAPAGWCGRVYVCACVCVLCVL